jgi:hypothetical protein
MPGKDNHDRRIAKVLSASKLDSIHRATDRVGMTRPVPALVEAGFRFVVSGYRGAGGRPPARSPLERGHSCAAERAR